MNKDVEVSLVQVVREKKRVVGSITQGDLNKALRNIKVGLPSIPTHLCNTSFVLFSRKMLFANLFRDLFHKADHCGGAAGRNETLDQITNQITTIISKIRNISLLTWNVGRYDLPMGLHPQALPLCILGLYIAALACRQLTHCWGKQSPPLAGVAACQHMLHCNADIV